MAVIDACERAMCREPELTLRTQPTAIACCSRAPLIEAGKKGSRGKMRWSALMVVWVAARAGSAPGRSSATPRCASRRRSSPSPCAPPCSASPSPRPRPHAGVCTSKGHTRLGRLERRGNQCFGANSWSLCWGRFVNLDFVLVSQPLAVICLSCVHRGSLC